jgi:hypothetical protein
MARVGRDFARATPILVLLTLTTIASAQPQIVMPGDDIAVEQPRIIFGLEDPANPGELFGPTLFNIALLDTGANGILLAQLSYFDDEIFDFNPNFYPVAHRSDGSAIQYEELGVAGLEFFDVLEPFHLNWVGDDGDVKVIENARILGAPALDAGSYAAVLGMPLMTGRVTRLDLRPVAQLEFMGVYFGSSLPAPTSHTYTVNLSILPPEFPGQEEPTDPLPTYSGVPLLNIVTSAKGNSTASQVLLDTGAQNSIISVDAAEAMGLILDPDDPNTDVLGFLEVGGIGGSVDMPIVQLDRLVLPTNEGTELVFTNVQVGVLDIPGLGGVMGMNILTTGYDDIVLGGADLEYGAFGDIFLDFTGGTGVLRFDMNPAFVPEPSVASVWMLISLTALARRRRGA